ncbi:TetR/AcrR family transcriptional regulator [Nocardia aobensis]|uniref:TetR/AcrR family transcriptional regulator n=1 Tax=Nocardia aobensis TaxID=257277 RepID=UPI000569A8F0|nr:TetR/AcrR family transcriptional regulator [Nocardia aobensis]
MFEKQSASVPSATRTAPVQRRSVERVRTILDVADVLFGENGYEATTLKAVSERSGIPITSIYHYFVDRNQLEIALLQRHLTQLEERLGAVWSGRSAPRSLRKAIDVMIDGYLSYFRGHPGFVELWFSGRNPAISDLALAFDRKQAEQLRGLVFEKKWLRADTPPLALDLVFEAGNRLFDVAFRQSRTGDDAVVKEARRFIDAYLETYV